MSRHRSAWGAWGGVCSCDGLACFAIGFSKLQVGESLLMASMRHRLLNEVVVAANRSFRSASDRLGLISDKNVSLTRLQESIFLIAAVHELFLLYPAAASTAEPLDTFSRKVTSVYGRWQP